MDALNDWALHLLTAGGYWAIAFLMFLENVVPPIPSELIMGLAGVEAGQGRLNLWLIVLVGTIGSTAGNYAWFLVGKHFGIERLHGFIDRHGRWLTLDWGHVEQVNRIFERHGGGVIFVFRFLPAFRTMVSLPAGLFHMGQVRFLACTFAGSAIWNSAWAVAGYELGRRVASVDAVMGPVVWIVVGLMVAAYLYRVITWKPRAG